MTCQLVALGIDKSRHEPFEFFLVLGAAHLVQKLFELRTHGFDFATGTWPPVQLTAALLSGIFDRKD